MINKFKEIYEYREMIFSSVKKELTARYKKSVLGFLWTFINPLCQIIIYTLVFSYILDMRASIENFPIFLIVALIPWLFFSSSITAGSMIIVSQQDMVKKIYFPREVLPISYVTSGFVNMLFCFIIVFLAIALFGIGFNFQALLFLPIMMILEYALTLGLTLIVSACTVYLRDLEHILGVLMQAWIYLTPIMYSLEIVPKEFRFVFELNPMTTIVEGYRAILYYGQVPSAILLLKSALWGICALVLGFYVFGKLQKGFAEEL